VLSKLTGELTLTNAMEARAAIARMREKLDKVEALMDTDIDKAIDVIDGISVDRAVAEAFLCDYREEKEKSYV